MFFSVLLTFSEIGSMFFLMFFLLTELNLFNQVRQGTF